MCIRDSGGSVQMILLQSAGILFFAVSVTISLLPTNSVKEISSAHAIFSSVYNDAFFTPVSYTHLDVYKRQARDLMLQSLFQESEAQPEFYIFCTLY